MNLLVTPLPDIINKPMPSPIIYVLDLVGLLGPLILFIVSGWQLWGNGIYWTLSIVVFCINICINIGLKQWIREPRPVGGQIMTTYDTYTGVLDYGMPSGHSQMAFGLVTFVYLVKQSAINLIGGVWIISLTVYQRWKYRRHSIEQLAIGAIVGFLVAYISYTAITMIITGQ
jgi:membrane-associated phospholipid phosphatase